MPVDLGGAVISAVFQVGLQRLWSKPVLEFFARNESILKLLTQLRIEILSANTVLDNAEEKEIGDRRIKELLDELKEVSYDAVDLMERVNCESDSRRRLEVESGRTRKLFMKLIPSSFDTFDMTVKSDLQDMLRTLNSILDASKYILGGVQNNCLQRLNARPLVDNCSVYGREDDLRKIVDQLVSGDVTGGELPVISIVGMVGIGKSTIVELVFYNEEVEAYFDIRVWVNVADEFDISKIAKKVLERLTSQSCGTEDDLQQLLFKVREALEGKKFLLVFDDVCDENFRNWEVLMSPFTTGKNGSKVIITTSNKNVALMIGNVKPYDLPPVSNEDCWKLFSKDVSKIVDIEAIPEQFISELLNKCKGIPLAVKLYSGLILFKAKRNEWRSILESDIWSELQLQANACDDFVWALWMCYHRMPNHLRQCFAYLSLLPQDCKFGKEVVILLWMAEGFLVPQEGKRLEDVGEECFDALLKRLMIIQSSQDELTFSIHPLLHGLAVYKSGAFCSRLDDNYSLNFTSKTRHLSFMKEKIDDFKKFEGLDKVQRLRTLLALPLQKSGEALNPLNYLVPRELLLRGRCLRVLSLSQSSIRTLPDWIGDLKQLRYLDLSSTTIIEMPNNVCTLYNLLILNLSNCKNLAHLPTNMGNLVELRHIYISGTPLQEMPLGLRNLKDLQTLTDFVVGKQGGSRIKELGPLEHLHGRLNISGLENVLDDEDASEANLEEKKSLTELSLEWHGNALNSQNEAQLLGKLRPHPNLEKLFINGYRGTTLPDWITDSSFNHVVEVHLLNFQNYCGTFPPFELLPFLKLLVVDGFDTLPAVHHQLHSGGAFERLETLKFSNMPEWTEWFYVRGDEAGGPFPRLKELHLQNCPKLNVSLHDCLPSLATLTIENCKQLIPLVPRAGVMDMAFPSLQTLTISKCPEQESILEGGLPSSINKLIISSCENLRTLDGSCFRGLTALRELRIDGCNELQCLPAEGLPNCLSFLYLHNCSLLNSRYQQENGEDWSKISDIPHLDIGVSVT